MKDQNLANQVHQAAQQYQQQAYEALLDQVKPKPPVLRNAVGAFLVGGLICLIAQALFGYFQQLGYSFEAASSATSMTMVFGGALATGLGLYDRLTKIGGAGAIIPITGFANSIVAPAMEYRKEGFVFGIGARMFTVAGPVLTYGFITSVLIGLILFYIS